MAVRGNSKGKEDLRQKRSKRHLSDALLSLMEERPFREISVVDICDRAMVHRTTFYAHFEDKNDLFRYVLEEMLKSAAAARTELEKEKGLRAGLLEEVRRGLEFFRVHRRFYLSGLSGGVGPELKTVEDGVARAIEELAREEAVLRDAPYMAEVVGRFYAGAIVSTVRWWLENDMPVSEEELLRQMERLLPPLEELDRR